MNLNNPDMDSSSEPTRLARNRSGDLKRIPTDLGMNEYILPLLASVRIRCGEFDFRRNVQRVRGLSSAEITAFISVYVVTLKAVRSEPEETFTEAFWKEKLAKAMFKEGPEYDAVLSRIIREVRRLQLTEGRFVPHIMENTG